MTNVYFYVARNNDGILTLPESNGMPKRIQHQNAFFFCTYKINHVQEFIRGLDFDAGNEVPTAKQRIGF